MFKTFLMKEGMCTFKISQSIVRVVPNANLRPVVFKKRIADAIVYDPSPLSRTWSPPFIV